MRPSLFNRYTAMAIGVQLLMVPLVWIADVVISPRGDSIFTLIFYFYLPAIYLVSTALRYKGERGMVGGLIFGILFGILIYGFIFGFMMSLKKTLILRRQSQE